MTRPPMPARTRNALIDIADRVATVALAAFLVGILLGEWFWRAATLGLMGAAVSMTISGTVLAVTGQPAAGGLISMTLRARRDQPTVRHTVPLRPTRRKGTT